METRKILTVIVLSSLAISFLVSLIPKLNKNISNSFFFLSTVLLGISQLLEETENHKTSPAEKCLCVFDIDRTITANECDTSQSSNGYRKSFLQKACKGCEADKNAMDTSYGENQPLQISADATQTVAQCKKMGCDVAIATDGPQDMDSKLSTGADVMNKVFEGGLGKAGTYGVKLQDPINGCRAKLPSQSSGGIWCMDKNTSPWTYPDKGAMTEAILKNNYSEGDEPTNVYFWDDSLTNRNNFCQTLPSEYPNINFYSTDPMIGGDTGRSPTSSGNCGLSGKTGTDPTHWTKKTKC